MAFLDEVDTVTTRLHLSQAKIPALIGLTAAVLVILGFVVVGGLQFFDNPQFVRNSADKTESADEGFIEGENEGASSDVRESHPQICVHVAGAVAIPGVVTLDEGARVQDALEKAGGITEGAFTDSLNLARVLLDGEQIIVPTQEEGMQDISVESIASGSVGGVVSVPQSSSFINGKLNINRASAEELDQLPGIGPSTAQKIVADRESLGPFQSADDLKRVSGIGEKKFASFADLICVG